MKYKYSDTEQAFVRVDNKGRRLGLTKAAAHKVCFMVMEGYSVSYIYDTVPMAIKFHTLKTFITAFKQGDIIGFEPDDYQPSFWRKLKRRLL